MPSRIADADGKSATISERYCALRLRDCVPLAEGRRTYSVRTFRESRQYVERLAGVGLWWVVQFSTAGAGRVARSGAPGADRDPGLTHVRSWSTVGRHVDLIDAAGQQGAILSCAFTMAPDCAGHDVRCPEHWLILPIDVFNAKDSAFGQVESRPADSADVALVQRGCAGFHPHFGDGVAVQLMDEAAQAGNARTFLSSCRDWGTDRDDVEPAEERAA